MESSMAHRRMSARAPYSNNKNDICQGPSICPCEVRYFREHSGGTRRNAGLRIVTAAL